jgi:hypothetical protein
MSLRKEREMPTALATALANSRTRLKYVVKPFTRHILLEKFEATLKKAREAA